MADTSHRRNESLLSVEEALRLVIDEALPLPAEEIGLEAALGRVLAEPVESPADIPACDRSAMDGYAVRTSDLVSLPAELDVAGFLPAGRSPEGIDVRPGTAVRIMTGAPLPGGADAVVMVERTEPVADGARVRVLESVGPGQNVFRRGEDLGRGARLLEAGTWIRPAEIGALAAVGKVRVKVRRRPVTTILSTGDEVIDPSQDPLPHQVRNSNGPALLAAMSAVGLDPVSLGIARDDPADLDARIAEGLSGEIFFLIGGVSVGDRDLVSQRLTAAGVRVIFHRIAMKPGKPLLFGRRGGCLVFGLPGNPLSALTDFLVFGVPAVRKMSGLPPTGLPGVRARLSAEVHQMPGRTWYRLARVVYRKGVFEAAPVPSSGSADLVSACRANAFVIVPADAARLEAGSEVAVLLWPGYEIL